MKRLFVVALLAMAMVACTETAEVTGPQAPQAPVEKFLVDLPVTEEPVNWQVELTMNPEVAKADFKTAAEPLLVKSVKMVETADVLSKTAACSETYGPFARYPNPFPGVPSSLPRWSFPQFSGIWPGDDKPTADRRIVIWYFGGIYPNSPDPQAFIPGVAELNGDLDCWTNSIFNGVNPSVSVNGLVTRGIDARNVTPVLGMYYFINDKNTFSYRFYFKPGNIRLDRRHADVNIDIASVTISAP